MKMERAILTSCVVALTLFQYPALGWSQQRPNEKIINEEQVRAELEVVLAERDAAAENQDLERFLSFYAADFTARLGGDRTLTRQETEQLIRLNAGRDILEQKQSSKIKSLKVRGNEAVLEIQYSSLARQRLQDGSIKEATGTGQHRETWVKTELGWRLRLIDKNKVEESKTTVNGKKVDPATAPSISKPAEPNTEDQSILSGGYALVFIYRLNDGALIKAPVYCDDVRVAEMTGGSFIKAKLLPGKHTFRSEKGSAIDLNIERGKIYFFVLKLKAGFPKGRGLLELDTTDVGHYGYKLPRLLDLRPLGRDNIDDTSVVIVEKP
jgi:Protein of unknown function (DUF2846)